MNTTISTEIATPPKSAKLRNSYSSVSRGANSIWDLSWIWICIEEFDFLDLVDFGGAAFLVASFIHCTQWICHALHTMNTHNIPQLFIVNNRTFPYGCRIFCFSQWIHCVCRMHAGWKHHALQDECMMHASCIMNACFSQWIHCVYRMNEWWDECIVHNEYRQHFSTCTQTLCFLSCTQTFVFFVAHKHVFSSVPFVYAQWMHNECTQHSSTCTQTLCFLSCSQTLCFLCCTQTLCFLSCLSCLHNECTLNAHNIAQLTHKHCCIQNEYIWFKR